MTPPKASDTGIKSASDMAAAVLYFAQDAGPASVNLSTPPTKPQIETLRRRADFLRAATARRVGTGSFLLQARPRGDDSPLIRIGFTASKKIGNAVARNRAKRRMRAVVRALLPMSGHAGWDYVLVAKPQATLVRPYCDMLADLTHALSQVHANKEKPRQDIP